MRTNALRALCALEHLVRENGSDAKGKKKGHPRVVSAEKAEPWVFATRIFARLPLTSKLDALCAANANQVACTLRYCATSVRAARVRCQRKEKTDHRIGGLFFFGSGTWIRTKNDGVRGRRVTLTLFRRIARGNLLRLYILAQLVMFVKGFLKDFWRNKFLPPPPQKNVQTGHPYPSFSIDKLCARG